MVEKIIIFQTVLLSLIAVLNIIFFIILLLKKDKSIKSKSPLGLAIDHILKNEPGRIDTVKVGLYENHPTKDDNNKFSDIIDAQMTIQEATNLVYIKNDRENETEFEKAQNFLDNIISLSETYKNS